VHLVATGYDGTTGRLKQWFDDRPTACFIHGLFNSRFGVSMNRHSHFDLGRRAFLGTGLAGLAFGLSGCATGRVSKTTAVGRWPTVMALLDSYVRSGKLAGAEVAIGRTGHETDFIGLGKQALGQSPAVSPDTLWRIYSQTKPVTGIAAMMLMDDGKMTLDQNLADFLPAFSKPMVMIDPQKNLDARPAARAITIRHLLTHTAGFGYTITGKGPLLDAYLTNGLVPGAMDLKSDADVVRPTSLAAFADRLATLPLLADPGSVWNYSLSLDLLGRVIEVASGLPFETFLQRRLFEPLGMVDTFFQVPDTKLDRFATNYGVTPEGLKLVDSNRPSVFGLKPAFPFGGAGLVSSARDYARFQRLLLNEGQLGRARLMKAETVRLAMSNLLPPGTVPGFGFGGGFGAGGHVTTASSDSGIGTFSWGGAAGTQGWVDPARGIHGNFMTQYMPASAYQIRVPLLQAVYRDLAAL
jgi:CubicO group peptidase (beta-lactamase class C family)